MDELLMKALRNGWRLGPGTVVRQSPPYRPALASRLHEILGLLYRRNR